MNVPVPATSTEIAAIRRRYLWMATSVFFLDLAITLVFTTSSGAWDNAWRSIGTGVALLLVVNWLFDRQLFEPIRHYLEGRIQFEDIQRRLTQLPLLSALATATLAFALWAFRFSVPYWVETSSPLLKPTIADLVVGLGVLTIFYFTYTYFVVSDYLAGLCTFIFDHYGRNLGLFFGSYAQKLMVALVVISIGPLAAILADLFSYEAERLQSEILVDIASAVMV